MFDDYELRKVARVQKENYILSTCYSVFSHKYETALSHLELNSDWTIIDKYDTMTEAEEGHDKWMKKIESEGVGMWMN